MGNSDSLPNRSLNSWQVEDNTSYGSSTANTVEVEKEAKAAAKAAAAAAARLEAARASARAANANSPARHKSKSSVGTSIVSGEAPEDGDDWDISSWFTGFQQSESEEDGQTGNNHRNNNLSPSLS